MKQELVSRCFIIFKIISIFFIFSNVVQAEIEEDKLSKEITYSVGMANISYSETSTQLTGQGNVSDPASGTESIIIANINWKFYPQSEGLSYYLTGSVPLLPGAGSSYFDLGAGGEYFFNTVKSKAIKSYSGTSINMTPTLRYFVGGEISIGYLVYVTEESRKSDIFFELGPTAGMYYKISDRWSIKPMIGFSKNTGILTNGFTMKILIGGTYFLED